MYNYPLMDAKGNVIGNVSLVSLNIPVLIMKGTKFNLGGSWDARMGDFKSFMIVPENVQPRRRRG